MSRTSVIVLVSALALASVVAACGGSAQAESSPAAGGGGGANSAGGADLPPLSVVIFGSAYDPATLAVTGKSASIRTGTPLVAVGRILQPRSMAGVTVQASSPSAPRVDPVLVAASLGDPSDVFAADLTTLNLGPGTWIVNFVSENNRVLASGNLSITP